MYPMLYWAMSPPSTAPTANTYCPQIWWHAASEPSPPIFSAPSAPAFREFIWLETSSLGTILEHLSRYRRLNHSRHVWTRGGVVALGKTRGEHQSSDQVSCRGVGFVLTNPALKGSHEPHF